MKKIISLILVMMFTMTALFAIAYNIEDNPRIKFNGLIVNGKKSDHLIGYSINSVRVDYSSAYSDLDYEVIFKDPNRVKDAPWADYKFIAGDDPIGIRIIFRRSNNNISYIKDLEVPCKPIPAINFPCVVYTGNTTEFGAVSGNDVRVTINNIPKGTFVWGYMVLDENDNILETWYVYSYDSKYHQDTYQKTILNASKAKAGKYKLCVTFSTLNQDYAEVLIKDFEIVD